MPGAIKEKVTLKETWRALELKKGNTRQRRSRRWREWRRYYRAMRFKVHTLCWMESDPEGKP